MLSIIWSQKQNGSSVLLQYYINVLAAVKELGLSNTDKQHNLPISAQQVEDAAKRVVDKFFSLNLPDLSASDKIRYKHQ